MALIGEISKFVTQVLHLPVTLKLVILPEGRHKRWIVSNVTTTLISVGMSRRNCTFNLGACPN